MIKQYSKFILILLVVILLFIPLFSVEAEYFTGYLDFDFYNLNNLSKSRINTDYSFFLKNITKNKLYYTLKYDSDQSNYDNLKEEYFWLDRSVLLKDLSSQNKYLKVKYNNSKVIYGRNNFYVDSPMFSNYYNNSRGLKISHANEKSSVNLFASRTEQISITDRVFNPSYSIIFLNNEKVVQGSETIYVNTLNKDNQVLKTNYLRNKSHYEIDYLNGKVIFDPLIYFLNQSEYNYELIINYKIKGNGLKLINQGYKLKTRLTQNTDLKFYKISEQNQKNIKGLLLSLNPDINQYYRMEYQIEQENKKRINISNDNGTNYINNNRKDREVEKTGIKYFNEFNSNNKIQGHSYKSIIRKPGLKEFSEFEHFIKINSNLNKKLNSEISYRRLDNSLKQNYYQYQTTITSQINDNLKLNTGFKYKNGTSGVGKEKALDIFFNYKYSEYLDISWGWLHNMPKDLYYGQYEVRYNPKTNSHIIFRNKVLNSEYREKLLEYKMSNRFKIFRTTKETLLDKSIVKKSDGLKYKINQRSSVSFIDSIYKSEKSSKENIVKYKLDLNKYISGGLNQRTYYTGLNGVLQKKRKGTKVSLNIKNKVHVLAGRLDKEINLTNTFKKERLKVSYHQRSNSKFYLFSSFEKEIKRDEVKKALSKDRTTME
ncbi:MAG: hypothetical protein ACOC1K_07515, partial [Nanoarchaeota archaeon]